MKPTTKIIGAITTFIGDSYGMKLGHKVRIIAVLPNAASPDYEPDAESSYPISDDNDLARHGGVKATDRIEVQPWIEKESRFSWVTCDPEAINLQLFKRLRQ
jgi:hypothetical protein